MFSKDNVTVKCDPLNPGDDYHGILKARFLASWASWRGNYQTKEVDKVKGGDENHLVNRKDTEGVFDWNKTSTPISSVWPHIWAASFFNALRSCTTFRKTDPAMTSSFRIGSPIRLHRTFASPRVETNRTRVLVRYSAVIRNERMNLYATYGYPFAIEEKNVWNGVWIFQIGGYRQYTRYTTSCWALLSAPRALREFWGARANPSQEGYKIPLCTYIFFFCSALTHW